MQNRTTLFLIFLVMLPALLVINCSISDQATADPGGHTQQIMSSETPIVINIDGDVSLTEEQNRVYWNPHSTGLTNASIWTVTLMNETEIFMKTTEAEAGHVATGAWWTTSFESNEKIQLCISNRIRVLTSFRANVVAADCRSGHEWLRIALACAIERADGSVVYTEMDFWDSPNTLKSPNGDIGSGGNIVYRGGDVVEYKIGQATLGEWASYSLDLTEYTNSAWSLQPGDLLESVYVVVEVIGGTTVTVKVDDLWITRLG